MRTFSIALAGLILAAAAPLGAAADRSVLYEAHLARGFVGNQQEYVVAIVPEGYDDLRAELDCNLHVGAISLYHPLGGEAILIACDGLIERVIVSGVAPGHYYGIASFTGVNGVTFRVTGAAG